MASARVNHTSISPGNLLDCPPSKYIPRGVGSRRASDGRDNSGEDNYEESDLDVLGKDTGAFEFRIGRNSDAILPADELFSDGKLLPLRVPTIGCAAASIPEQPCLQVRSPPGTPELKPINENSAGFLRSPRRSSRWKELLGFKKLNQTRINTEEDKTKTTPSLPHNRSNLRRESVKNFLRRRSSKSPAETSIEDKSVSFPLLTKDYDSESASIPSRISSSSSGGEENEDLAPRLSLDSQKPAGHSRNRAQTVNNRRKVRFVVRRGTSTPSKIPSGAAAASAGRRAFDASAIGGFSPDSPRMNPSGKVIFHGGLERSSSSPGSFLSEPPRNRHRGVTMMRSYSANVPVTPILNVPVCSSLRGSSKTAGAFGFPLFSSSPKKEAAAGRSGGWNKNCPGNSRHHNTTVVKTKRQ
ncbi:unnamed protein product [Cuscuta campestris]|uniref:Uncharacterized protein n=1 Tax=Cuscuta campestris TaxID=132261 RepID=A0A484N945_9ASTE|nr:unnamed protein product [Cuscuta campestris]